MFKMILSLRKSGTPRPPLQMFQMYKLPWLRGSESTQWLQMWTFHLHWHLTHKGPSHGIIFNRLLLRAVAVDVMMHTATGTDFTLAKQGVHILHIYFFGLHILHILHALLHVMHISTKINLYLVLHIVHVFTYFPAHFFAYCFAYCPAYSAYSTYLFAYFSAYFAYFAFLLTYFWTYSAYNLAYFSAYFSAYCFPYFAY